MKSLPSLRDASMHPANAAGALPQIGRLHGFILLSVALHAMALLFAGGRSPSPEISLGQSALHVRLDAQSPRNNARNQERLVQHATAAPAASAPSQTSGRDAPGTGEADGSAIGHEALQNYLLGALNSELSRHLTYPHLARMRGWQGTVTVGVDITPDGQLHNMRLVKSSGFSLLDQASLAGLHRVRALPIPAAQGWGEPMEVILPIRFHLTDNS